MINIYKYIPNCLSALRILLSFAIVYFYFENKIFFLNISTIICMITDFLDGFLARRWRIKSKIGSILDPFADKIFTIIIFFIGYLENILPRFVLKFIIFKEIILIMSSVLILLFLKSKKKISISANIFGKITMIINSIAFIIILFRFFFYFPISIYFWYFIVSINFTSLFNYIFNFIFYF